MDFKELRLLSSTQNPEVKALRALLFERRSQRDKRILLEGLRLVDQGLQVLGAGEIYYEDSKAGKKCFEQIGRPGVKLPDSIFQSLCDTQHGQGVLMVVARPTPSPITELKGQRFLYLDGVADPGNLGTMARTVESLAFDGIILSPGSVSPYNRKAIRASMGSLLAFPIAAAKPEDLKALGLPILVADLEGGALSSFTGSGGFVLAMGNEAHGVSSELKRLGDASVYIESFGTAESLNVAAACAILAYTLSDRCGFF